MNTLLNAHKNHDLPLFGAFVDLVKAYDTTDHDLLIKILERHSAPPKFVAAVRTMYTNLKAVLKIDQDIWEILLGPQFDRVYNNHRPINLSVLDNVPQCPTLLNIDSPITFEEINVAIYKLKNGKSPGLNNILPEAYKAMNGKMR